MHVVCVIARQDLRLCRHALKNHRPVTKSQAGNNLRPVSSIETRGLRPESHNLYEHSWCRKDLKSAILQVARKRWSIYSKRCRKNGIVEIRRLPTNKRNLGSLNSKARFRAAYCWMFHFKRDTVLVNSQPLQSLFKTQSNGAAHKLKANLLLTNRDITFQDTRDFD